MTNHKKGKKNSPNATSTTALFSDTSKKFDKISKKMTRDILQTFIKNIEENVVSGNKVRLDKIGILHVKDRAARTGRNPQTGKQIQIPASKKVVFKVASSLKEAVGIKKKTTKPVLSKKKK